MLYWLPRMVLLRFQEASDSPKVSQTVSGGHCDLGLPAESGAGTQGLTSCCFRALGSPFLCWASWTQAQRATELSCPWPEQASGCSPPTLPAGRPFLPGCTEPSVRTSPGQGIFLPEPLKTQPALEGFIVQMSWIGSAPAGDSGRQKRSGAASGAQG